MNTPWYEGWTDVTYPIFEGMTGWPGQPVTSFDTLSCIHCGDQAKVTMLHFSAHSGTHMDAPNHFMAEGIDISLAPIHVGLGPVRIAAIDCPAEVTPAFLDAYEARTRPLLPGERLILRTPNSDKKFSRIRSIRSTAASARRPPPGSPAANWPSLA
jgi:arylformamidase